MLMTISSDLMEGPNDDEIAKENAIGVSVDPNATWFLYSTQKCIYNIAVLVFYFQLYIGTHEDYRDYN